MDSMHYVMVGGGSAGWMTAAALAHAIEGDGRITLVESEEIGTVGVGAAAIPPLQFCDKVLGIDFHNWGSAGHRYFHQCGEFGVDIKGVTFHQWWLRIRARGHSYPISDYAPAFMAEKTPITCRPGQFRGTERLTRRRDPCKTPRRSI